MLEAISKLASTLAPLARWVGGIFSRRAARKEGERKAERKQAQAAAQAAMKATEARRELGERFKQANREAEEARGRGETTTAKERLAELDKRISGGKG